MFLSSQKHPRFEEFVAATKDGLIVYDASQIEDTDEGGVQLKPVERGVLW